MSADDFTTDEATRRVTAMLPEALGGDFIADWVLVADVVLPDGKAGTWHLAAQDIRLSQQLGLLEWAAAQVRAAIVQTD